MDGLKIYIERHIWSNRVKRWRIIKSVTYFPEMDKVIFTDTRVNSLHQN
uniref:Uncharacterized protein n=1 Tax=Siphoviridae sp. ctTrD1 TaxID=2825524 RepID=A0A8S5PQ97_9CAUD|nr:MAG TPA: hypothetical protein [Siphoviridae sp. ctTrD1]